MKATASLLLLVSLLVVLGWQGRAGSAEAAGSTPDLAASIDVDGGGDDCDTRASTGSIGTMCTVSVGGMFTVKGHVDSFTGISGTGGYGGIHFRFNHSAGLTLMQRSLVTELGPAGSPYWPICSSRSESKPAGGYEPVCHSAGPTSTHIGKVVEVDYTCTTAGAQTITMLDSTTFLYNSSHVADNSDKEGDEVLTVTCAASVGGVAELSGAADASPLAAEEQESFVNTGLVAGLAALAGTSVLGAGVWYARRRVR